MDLRHTSGLCGRPNVPKALTTSGNEGNVTPCAAGTRRPSLSDFPLSKYMGYKHLHFAWSCDKGALRAPGDAAVDMIGWLLTRAQTLRAQTLPVLLKYLSSTGPPVDVRVPRSDIPLNSQ
jgi:hypothetical protein